MSDLQEADVIVGATRSPLIGMVRCALIPDHEHVTGILHLWAAFSFFIYRS